MNPDDKFLDAQLRDTAASIVGAMGGPSRMGGKKSEMLQLGVVEHRCAH